MGGAVPKNLEARTGSSWLQWPTLCDGGDVDVVGEHAYQAALEDVAGGRTKDGTRTRVVMAELAREPANSYDANAVVVMIDGRKVAYIPRDWAPRFGEALVAFGGRATCRARLKGGWDSGDGDRGSIGVQLDIVWPLRRKSTTEPFLPGGRDVAVLGEENSQPAIESIGERNDLVATLVPSHAPTSPDRPFLMVQIDGRLLGMFSPAQTARYLRTVQTALDTGFPATCRGRVERGKKKREVVLSLVAAWAD